MPRIAIAITCYNQSAYTRRAVESLLRTTPNVGDHRFDFAVFDDCSTDDSRDVAYSSGGNRITYWCGDQNRGLTSLWNAAYRRFADCEYLVLANNDVIFTPHWCSRIVDVMRDRGAEMAGPVTNGPGHVPEQDVRRYVYDYHPSDDWEELLRLPNKLEALQAFVVPRINGFCMVCETSLLRRAQDRRPGEPFDPTIRDFGNEDEIQMRLNPRPLVVPSSFVFHYKRVTFGDARVRDFTVHRPRQEDPPTEGMS